MAAEKVRPGRFDGFVMLAGMRTGSNHLEASLDALSDVTGHGELFNPVFLGGHDRTELFGIDLAARAADPMRLLAAVTARTEGLPGFRYFHDHDPRVLGPVLEDPRWAKIVLTRDPVESWVSLAIARETGQWRLTNPKMARSAQVHFDAAAFDAMVAAQQAFRERVDRALQVTGQTAFRIDYRQIGDLAVLNGLAAFLGSADRLSAVPGRLKRQNPGRPEDKVSNPEQMRAHLTGLDPFGGGRAEPRVEAPPTELRAAADSRLIHLALPGGPGEAMADWLARLDGAPASESLDARALRRWLRGAKGFTSFSVIRHPLERAHGAWRAMLAAKGPEANGVRRVLVNQHGMAASEDADGFAGFLRALGAVLGGQSALPIAPAWAGQAALLSVASETLLPHRLIRETEAQAELDALADAMGRPRQPYAPPASGLARIHRAEHDDLAVAAYRRDFRQFGFKRWGNS